MTTTIDPRITLGDLVTAHPSLARSLERQGFDYCCGGTTTLEEACRSRDLDPEEVAATLASAVAPDDGPDAWANLDVASLVEHIVSTHHAYLWDEMPRIDALLAKIVAVHGLNHPELGEVQEHFGKLRAEFEPHLQKEETILFPMIAAQAPEVSGPVQVMIQEHETAGEILEHMRAAAHDYVVPDDGCATYRACYEALEQLEADTHLHVHKENNRLFPLALGR